jgi:hypothetical protein
LDFGQVFKVFEQGLFALWSQACNPIQSGAEGILRAELAVEGNGKAVYLVLDAVEEEKFF